MSDIIPPFTRIERDALLRTLAQERDEFGKRETELVSECNRWCKLAEGAREALEKISKDVVRIEYVREEMARLEPSETAQIAKSALAAFPREER